MAATVNTERDGRVLTVRLDNPPRNFMTTRMVRELDVLTRSLERDRTIGAVVLTGATADAFITHFDVGELLAGAGSTPTVSQAQAGAALRAVKTLARIPGARPRLRGTPAVGALAVQDIHAVFDRMNRLDKVFVAAVNGVATGGGCELALACDVRLMADGEGRIGLPEATLGLIPGAGGTQRLARVLGPGRALEMMLEGRLLAPREAVEAGLVHRLARAERLLDEARSTAERLARRSPAVISALKRAVYEGASRPLAEGLHIERAGFLATASTPAAARAMAAYQEESGSRRDVTREEALETLERWREHPPVDMAGE